MNVSAGGYHAIHESGAGNPGARQPSATGGSGRSAGGPVPAAAAINLTTIEPGAVFSNTFAISWATEMLAT